MTQKVIYNIAAIAPSWLINGLRSSPALRTLVRSWAQGRNLRIPTGVGAGLWFNAGHSNPAYALGTNERPVQAALAEHLHAGATFFDIGGNVGFFTVIGARLVGPTGHVFVFEPVPDNAAIIRRNLALNHFENVTLFEKAVAQTSGRTSLHVSSYSGGAVLASVGKPPELKETITVGTVSVDELVAQQLVRPPAVVKIDVEGAEMDVFHGMTQTLQTFKPVIIYEIDDGTEAPFRTKCDACAQFLRAMGYELTELENSYTETDWIVGHFVATPRK
jgi:FkbM family methyltransferase